MKWINPQRRAKLIVKVLRLLGIERGFEQPFSDQEGIVSYADSQVSKKDSSDPLFRVEAYLISGSRKREIEAQKAMVISMMRHDKWKAGGPI